MRLYEKFQTKKLQYLRKKRLKEESRAKLREHEQKELKRIRTAKAVGKGKKKTKGLSIGGYSIGLNPDIGKRSKSPMGLTPMFGREASVSGMVTPFGGAVEPTRRRRKKRRKRK